MKNGRLIAILFSVVLSPVGLSAAERYNILFLFADDHAYDSIGLMTDGYVQTPTMDTLASTGVYFERAYNMGSWSGAVCVASRTMLNTGRSLWNAKRLQKGNQLLKHKSWSQRLQSAGYRTFFAGKWHVKGYDPEQLFEFCGTIRPGMPSTDGDHNRPIEGVADRWSASDLMLEGYWEGGKHWSVVTADETIEFLQNYGRDNDGKPFFAYVAFNAPHDPRQSPQSYLDRYPVESVPLPHSFMESYPYTNQIGVWNVRAERMAPRPRTEFAIKTHRREYYALISHLDTQLGRIIDTLKEEGLYENTVIIYTADHGLSLGNHSFMAKQSMYDHSLASPFIIAGPEIPKGVRSKQRIYIQDVVPTTLEIAGQSRSDYADIEFESLLPLGRDGSSGHTVPIYGGYKNLSRCIVHGQWKLIYYTNVDKFRLFDLETDPNELMDVSDLPENRAVIERLSKILMMQQKTLGDEQVSMGAF
ncbi:MAG: sulfatase-like hydrolase/transferase [Verrucomicrobiota bacterium]